MIGGLDRAAVGQAVTGGLPAGADGEQPMAEQERAVAALERSSEHWLRWLAGELARRAATPREELLALFDVLEEWFGSEEFGASPLAANLAAPAGGDGPAAAAVLERHRQALRRLLQDRATAAGARDPAGLAARLALLVDGAIVGALIDRQPRVARHARELTELALGSAGA